MWTRSAAADTSHTLGVDDDEPAMPPVILYPPLSAAPNQLVLLASPLGEFASALRAQLPFLPLLVLVGVGLAAVVAVVFAHRPGVRPAFLAGFFSLLVVVNAVGLPVLPFMHWQKFSDVSDAETTFYDFRVVTADGAEVRFDPRSVTNVDGVYMVLVTDEMRTADDDRRAELSAYMLERARIHRTKVETRSPLHYLRFPPHSLSEWTVGELDGHAPFVGIRTYERTLVFADDGTSIVSDTEVLVFEYVDPANGTEATLTTATTPRSGGMGATPT